AMVEGQQHVVDRRAVGHDGVSRLAGNSGLPSSHETAALSTLRCCNRRHGTGAGALPGEKAGPYSDYSLLKWLNSLYRPALPEESARGQPRRFPDSLLGRRQVVRQWILIPPCGGSNPPAPARQSAFWRILFLRRERPANRGLFEGHEVSALAMFELMRPNLPKVSSRFQ